MKHLHGSADSDSSECWPELAFDSWKETCATLHMWMQIVGKVRLALAPATNHWWNVPLYVSARGLTTSLIPYGTKSFEVEFDFVEHQLRVDASNGQGEQLKLAPRSVADFYAEFMAMLKQLGIEVAIWKMPVEVADPIPFDKDHTHASYDAASVLKFWRILVSTDYVFKVFSTRFIGKTSPVHFFWGSLDLAVTRFSGRRAPPRNDADPILKKIMAEAYSHEVISAGFWPGGGGTDDAAFYCYAAPQPVGFEKQALRPKQGFYNSAIGEYVLMYEDLRKASSPTAALLEFLQSTYDAGANTGKWDREALEKSRELASD
ncbi:MAG TPA: DUF5996 family protein [Verrucomicrobiae bacterium]|nr:DUF5996 family protein [Verrucomicrobiae bacterium]